jgi:transcriptional regulator
MYVPPHFAVHDLATLHDFIDRHPFGLLISSHDQKPFGTHLPLLLDRSSGTQGTIRGHVARQNPQWENMAGQELLIVFNGPHAYVSPTWYQAERVVPTWNFVAVHVYGQARLMQDTDDLVALLRDLTDTFERDMPAPWTFDPTDPFVRKLATQVVGFRIEIDRIEGKSKLNQNHPPERRQRVIDALRRQDYEDARRIAELMDVESRS